MILSELQDELADTRKADHRNQTSKGFRDRPRRQGGRAASSSIGYFTLIGGAMALANHQQMQLL